MIETDQNDPDELRRLRERQYLWERSIPSRFRYATLADVDEPQSGSLRDWATELPGNLVLLGPVGVGKTHAAVATLRLCHDLGYSIMFAPIVEALDMLRPGGGDDVAARLATVRVLLLDDLGAERPTDWTAERLYSVINRRWLDEKVTIVTSNLPPDELEPTLDPRLYSRLVDGATATRLTGPDRRRG